MSPSRDQREKIVFDLLREFHGLEPLKKLFWSELNYQRVNQPLSRRGWNDKASNVILEDPVLFASGGQNDDFHLIYARLSSDNLLLVNERLIVQQFLRDHPYALFIFSNADQDRWHFVNIKYDELATKRRLFRRITISREERLRTATERISLLDLESI